MKRRLLPRRKRDPEAASRLRDLARALGTTILVVVFVALVVFLFHLDKILKDTRVPRNVFLLGANYGGIAKDAAVKRAREELSAIGSRPLYVVYGDRCHRVDPSRDLGFRVETERTVERLLAVGNEGSMLTQLRVRIRLYTGRDRVDLPVRYFYDKEKLRRTADLIALGIGRPPEAARVVEAGGVKRLRRETPGIDLPARAVAEQILKTLGRLESYRSGTLFLEGAPLRPTIDFANKLVQLNAKPTVSFAVSLPDDPAYGARARAAAERLDGLILTGAEKVSVATLLSGLPAPPARPRDEATGFFPDPEALGPAASALYNASLLAGLDVVIRRGHEHAPAAGGYVEAGRDAALDFAGTDVVLRNRPKATSIFETLVSGGTFEVRVHATEPLPGEVSLVITDVVKKDPPERRFVDPSLGAGRREVLKEGMPGLTVTVERVLTRAGSVIDRLPLTKDEYQPVPREVRTGEKKSR